MAKLFYKDSEICNVYIANNFKDRLFGYMFRKKPHHEAILFNPCNSIHTFFMKFNIDVLFLNKDMEVIKKIDGLEKGRVVYVRDACYVVEAKEGAFSQIKEGEKIYFK